MPRAKEEIQAEFLQAMKQADALAEEMGASAFICGLFVFDTVPGGKEDTMLTKVIGSPVAIQGLCELIKLKSAKEIIPFLK